MGYEDNGHPPLLKLHQPLKQLLCFLGCEHGRGLIQDDQLGTAVEDLKDLQLLLHSNAHVPDSPGSVNFKIIFFGHLVRDQDVPFFVGHKTGLFQPQHHVLRPCQGIHQHKMLVHHTDSVFNGLLAGLQLQLLAV